MRIKKEYGQEEDGFYEGVMSWMNVNMYTIEKRDEEDGKIEKEVTFV